MKQYLLSIFILAFLCSCSKEDTVTPSQVYNIQVLDAFDVPFNGLEVGLSYNLGCTYNLDNTKGNTNDNGEIALTTNVNPDTINAIMIRQNWGDSLAYQAISVSQEGYFVLEKSQNQQVVPPFRVAFKETDLITIRLVKQAQLNITYSHPALQDKVFFANLTITGQKGSLAISQEFNSLVFGSFIPSNNIYIPADANLNIEWEIFEVVGDNDFRSVGTGNQSNVQVEHTMEGNIELFQ